MTFRIGSHILMKIYNSLNLKIRKISAKCSIVDRTTRTCLIAILYQARGKYNRFGEGGHNDMDKKVLAKVE